MLVKVWWPFLCLYKLFFAGIENSNDQIMVTNQRQASLLHKAKKELEDVIQAVEDGVPVDIAQIVSSIIKILPFNGSIIA